MRRYFSESIVLVSTGAAVEDMKGKVVDQETVRVYIRIAIENLNSAMTELRVGVESGNKFKTFEEQDSPAAGTVYWSNDPLYVFDEERLQVKITGATTGDKINVHNQGYDEVEDA